MDNFIKYAKTGGLIVITAGLVYVIFTVIVGYQETINNHLEHTGSYIQENTEVLIELKGAVEANTVQTGRLEQLLDRKL